MIFTVTIDGPAAAGKGTISKAVAAHFGFAHLDTGLLYRAVAAKVIAGADPVVAAQTLDPRDLENDALRSADVAQAASQVAVNPAVRSALTDFQRNFAKRRGGAVLDGRDIGTVICPHAPAKLFITASPACRADRRFKELHAKDATITADDVLADVIARDKRDTERATAPLIAAHDAHQIDTSDMSIAQAVDAAIKYVSARLP